MLEEGAVYVDGRRLRPGEHDLEAEVTLPAGIELVKREPAVVHLEIAEPKPEPKIEPKPEPKPEPKNGARK